MKKIIIITTIISIVLLGVIIYIANSTNFNQPVVPPIPSTELGILAPRDFYLINKERNWIITLGMPKSEARSAIRLNRANDIFDRGPYQIHTFNDFDFFYRNNELRRILTEGGYGVSTSWEIYGGINAYTSREEIIEILGVPTMYEENNFITYIFFKTEDGNYQKLKNEEEVEQFIKKEAYISQVNIIEFLNRYDDYPSILIMRSFTEIVDIKDHLQWLLIREGID